MQQSKKNGLQDVLGIGGVTSDAVGRTEDEAVVCAVSPFEFFGDGYRRFL